MRIFGKNIDIGIPALEKHGAGKLFRHAAEHVIGSLPFVARDRRLENIRQDAGRRRLEFIAAERDALRASPGLRQLVSNYEGRTDLTGLQKEASIKAIVRAHYVGAFPDVDQAVKRFATANNIRGVVRRQLRYEARNDPEHFFGLITRSIRAQLTGEDIRQVDEVQATDGNKKSKTLVVILDPASSGSSSDDETNIKKKSKSGKTRDPITLVSVNVPPSSNGKKPEVPDGGSQSSEESDSFPDLPKLPDNPTLNLIASGAMGDIYKVKVAPGQDYEHCVLKRFQLKYQDSAWIELDNNCAIGSRLGHHPNIAKFLGPLMDEDVGELLLAFEYIHGSDVGAMFDKCRPILPADDLLRLAQHVIRGSVSALAALENIDHAHNDIKPNNILFDENSKEAKLVDFGNAHLHGYHRPLGNPSYCPPERLGTVNAMLFPSQGGASSKNASQTPYLKMNSRDLRKIEEFERNANLSPDHLYVTPRGRKEFRPDHLKLEDEKKKKVAITNKTDAFSIGQVLYRLVEGREYYAFENLPKAEDLPPSQAAAIEKIRPQADNFVANLANTGGGTANNLTLLYLLGQSADVFKDRGQVFTKAEQTDPAKIAVQYYDFVNMAMAPDESKRYSCVQLLDHPFLANPPSKEEVEGILAKRYPLPKEFTL